MALVEKICQMLSKRSNEKLKKVEDYQFPGISMPAPKYRLSRAEQRNLQLIRGLTFFRIISLFHHHHWRIDPHYRAKALHLILTSPLFSILKIREHFLFSETIKNTPLCGSPIFILGHWRNGTTHLHNLMCKDPQFTYLRSYQALFADSFLLPRLIRWQKKWKKLLSMDTRPMDNVKFDMQEPAEDEFALAAITGNSPYERIIFPRTMGAENGFKYPHSPTEFQRESWKASFMWFLKRLTVLENRRIVLKSPTHTARINILLEMFPDAKFIHVIRHPYDVFPSNLRLWRDAFSLSFLQSVGAENMVEMVLSTYEQVYQCYHHEKNNIPEKNLIEIKFEEIEKEPITSLKKIYDHLEIGGFDMMLPHLQTYQQSVRGYKKNKFELSPEVKSIVYHRWRRTFEQYDYSPDE